MAEGQGGNVASVGLSLDSSAFNSGVARALADISRLLTGLRELQAASQKTNLGQLGATGRSGAASGAFTPATFARDIRRLAIPAIRQLDRAASTSPLLTGRMARGAGFDPAAMAAAINRQTIPAIQRLNRTMGSFRDSDFMKEFEAGRAARERAHRAMLERESRITQEIAKGTTKRLEREQARMIQAQQAENRRAADPNTQGSRQLRAAIEMRRQLAEQKRYVEAHPTPTQTRYAGGGRGGGSREGRWGDVADLKGIPKDWRKVLMQLEQQGWRIEPRSGGHPVAYPTSKQYKPITFPSTPSDHRDLLNFISKARRSGGVINGRGYRDEAGPFVERQRGFYEDPSTKKPTLRANYRMAALEELVTSNLPSYPPVMQPRPRGVSGVSAADPNSRQQIERMIKGFERGKVFAPSANLEEGLIATVANAAGQQFVASGNARTMALQAIAKQGTPLRNAISGFSMEYLKSNPTEFGQGEVAALKKAGASIARSGKTPVLIREIAGGVEGLAPQRLGQLGLQLNARTGLSESEIAIAASRMLSKVPAEVLAGDPRKIVAAGKGPAYEALKSALSSEVLGEHVMGTRYKGASGGVAFKGMMEQMLYARAYGNNPATAQMLTAAFSGEPSEMSSSVRAALGRSLGPQLRLRERINAGEVPAGMDPIFNSLPGALQLMQRALGTGGQGPGWITNPETLRGNPAGALRALLSQKTMFGDPTTAIERRLAANMLAVGPQGLSPFLSSLGMYGSRAEGAQMGMFGASEGGLLQATSNPRQAIALAQKAAAQYQEALKTDPALKGTGKAAVTAREAVLTSIVEGVYSGMPAQAAAVAQKVATSSPQAAAVGQEIVQGTAAAVTQAAVNPKRKKFTFKLSEEEQAAFLSKLRGPVVAPASQGGGYQMFPPEEPRTGLRRPNAQRMTELGGYGISPREIGVAEGSVKARAGGYLPYSESSPQRQMQYNNRLTRGYATLMGEIEGHLAQPGPKSTAALAAKIPEVERLYKVAMERGGLGMDPMNAHAEVVAKARAILGPVAIPQSEPQRPPIVTATPVPTTPEGIPYIKVPTSGELTEAQIKAVQEGRAKLLMPPPPPRQKTGRSIGGPIPPTNEGLASLLGIGPALQLGAGYRPYPGDPMLAALTRAQVERRALALSRGQVEGPLIGANRGGLDPVTGAFTVNPKIPEVTRMQGGMLRALLTSESLSAAEKARQISLLSGSIPGMRGVPTSIPEGQWQKLGSGSYRGPKDLKPVYESLKPLIEQYGAARTMGYVELARGSSQGYGYWDPKNKGLNLSGLEGRSSGAIMRTLVHELAHGSFGEAMRTGYKQPGQVQIYGPKGESMGMAPHGAASALLAGEPTRVGHLDPKFYEMQARILKSEGGLFSSLLFHNFAQGGSLPGGLGLQGTGPEYGIGKLAAQLTPQLEKLASPQQLLAAQAFTKTMNTLVGGIEGFAKGRGNLEQTSNGIAKAFRTLGESSSEFKPEFLLGGAARLSNFIRQNGQEGLAKMAPEQLRAGIVNSILSTTTGALGPGRLLGPMSQVSGVHGQISEFLKNASEMEKGYLAMAINPQAFVKEPGAKPFYQRGDVDHLQKAQEILSNVAQEAERAASVIPAATNVAVTRRAGMQLPVINRGRMLPAEHSVVVSGQRYGAGGGQFVETTNSAGETVRQFVPAQRLPEVTPVQGPMSGSGALVVYDPRVAAQYEQNNPRFAGRPYGGRAETQRFTPNAALLNEAYMRTLSYGGQGFFGRVGYERLTMPAQEIASRYAGFRGAVGQAAYNSPLSPIGGMMSQFRQATGTYAEAEMGKQQLRAAARQQYQGQVAQADAFANAQTRLNRVLGTGTVNFRELGKVMSEVGNGFTSGALSSLRFAANLAIGQQAVFAFVGMINHLRGGIIEFNAKLEAAAVGFNTLFRNAGYTVEDASEKTKAFIGVLRDFANVTNFRFGDLETAALRMKAFGFEVDNVTAAAKNQMPILEEIPNPWAKLTGEAKSFRGALVNIGDAVAALGAEDDKLRRVTYALGQMNSAGRVYQNDMMQLANAGIAGYDILAKAVKKQLENDPELMRANKAIYNKLLNPRTAVEEIRKLARVGRLVGPEAVQAILQGLGQQYGGGMKAFSRTFQGAMTTLADTSQSLIATAFKPLFDVTRDLVVQLADAFQTSEWTGKADNAAKVIQKVAEALRSMIPGTADTIMKVLGSFFETFAKLGSSLGSTTNGLGSFVNNFAAGVKTIGDLLQNSVIRNLLVAGVTAKLVMGTIASNPLLATIGLIVSSIGAISKAIETNAFGFGDLAAKVQPEFDKILANISGNFIPGVTSGLSDGLGAFFAIMGAFIRAVTPLLVAILDIISNVGSAIKPFASVLGVALAAFVGKKVLIDGMAAAMGKFAAATGAAVGRVTSLKEKMALYQAFGTTGRYYGGDKLMAMQTMQLANGQSRAVLAPAEQGGIGIGGPTAVRAALALANQFALLQTGAPLQTAGVVPPQTVLDKKTGRQVANPMYQQFLNTAAFNPQTTLAQYQAIRGARKEEIMQELAIRRNKSLTPEQRQAALANVSTAGRQAYRQFRADTGGAGSSSMKALEASFASMSQGMIAQLGQFMAKIRSTGLSLETLKTIAKAVGSRLAGMATAAMGMGMLFSAIGGALNVKELQAVGDTLTTIGFATTGLTMMFNALTVAVGAAALPLMALMLAIGGLIAFISASTTTEQDKKGAKQVSEIMDLRDQMVAMYGEEEAKRRFPDYFPENLTLPEKKLRMALPGETPDSYDWINNIALKLDYDPKDLAAVRSQFGFTDEDFAKTKAYFEMMNTDTGRILSLFQEGKTAEQIAEITGLPIDRIKLQLKEFYETTGSDNKDFIAKVLSDSLDATGAALKEAQEAYEKAMEPFQKNLSRLTSRTQEVMQALFESEKKALEDEKKAALENTLVMYNGEQVRLGVLQQQYDAMKLQREEMDRMAELEKQRTAAAEAALNIFDASVDPLERARAARESARDLFNQVGTSRLDEMQRAITAGQGNVAYTETEAFYNEKMDALQKDQAERMRTVQEQIDDLMQKIKEGKIGTAAAQQQFKDIFAQAGLDLDVAQTQGYSFMSAFGDGFMDAMNTNIKGVFSKLPGLIMKALEMVKQDKLYQQALDAYNAIVTMGDKITGKEYKSKYLQPRLAGLNTLYKDAVKYLTSGEGVKAAGGLDKAQAMMATLLKKKIELENMISATSDTAVIDKSLALAGDSSYRSDIMGIQLPGMGNRSLVDYLRLYMGYASRDRDNYMNNPYLAGGAAGGTITTAGQFMVGERGPEMIEVGPNGIRVVPNHKLPSWLRSSAGALGAVNMGLGGYAFGTGSGDSGMRGLKFDPKHINPEHIRKYGNVSMAGTWQSALGMLLMRAGAPIAALASRAGNGLTRGMEWMIGPGPLGKMADKIVSLGSSINNIDPENLGPKMKLISTLMKPQMDMMAFAQDVGYTKYMSTDFLKTMAAAGGTIGLTGLEAQGLMGAPGFLMNLLNGGPRSVTPPNVHAHPSRSPISGTVNIHNPQLNSAADIDRLAERVAEAQVRALRNSGYVKR